MGTYNYSKKMLIEELTSFLDLVDGDFTTKDLVDALEFMKSYAPTSDSSNSFNRVWEKKIGDLK